MKKLARFEITQQLLGVALALPDGAVIHDIVKTHRPGVFEIVIEHPDLPVTGEEHVIARVTPCYTVDFNKRPATWMTVEFVKHPVDIATFTVVCLKV